MTRAPSLLLWLLLAWAGPAHAGSFDARIAAVEALSDARQLGAAEAELDRLPAATPAERARIALARAWIALRHGRALLAEQSLLDFADAHPQADARTALRARIALAQARIELGDLDLARRELEALLAHAGDDELAAEAAAALASALLYAGEAAKARRLLESTLERPLAPRRRAELDCWLSFAAILLGDLAAARRASEEAIELRAGEEAGIGLAVAHYFHSLVERGSGRPVLANAALERALELLEEQRLRQGTAGDTRAQWAAQFAFFHREAIAVAVAEDDLPRALALAQRYRADERAPGLARRLAAADAGLRPGETLLSFVVHDTRTLALVAHEGRLASFPIALSERELREQVGALTHLIAARDRADAAALRGRSHALYRVLVEPALALAPATRSLLIQPDAALHELPFAALSLGQDAESGYLVERLSLSLVDVLPRPPAPPPARAWLVVADPTVGPVGVIRDGSPVALPGARREAAAIARLYAPAATLLTGEEASEARVKRAPAGFDLHIAAHMERDPLDEQRGAIRLRAGEGEDGALGNAEIVALRQARALVVLSGCASQRGALAGGSGALSLARAWRASGSAQVIATLWPVADQASADLMADFHSQRQQQPSLGNAEALAQAQRRWLALARAPTPWAGLRRWWLRMDEDDWTLPYHWAGVVLTE